MQIGGLSGLSYPTARGVIDRFKKAYEQRPKAMQAWLDEHYPEIEVRAKTEGAEIHRGDETALVNTDVRGRCYAPAGKTPVGPCRR